MGDKEEHDLLVELKKFEDRATDMLHLRDISVRELEQTKTRLIGRTVKARGALYVIRQVDIGLFGFIRIKGRKVLASGNWGTKSWDLGRLYARNLVPLGESE